MPRPPATRPCPNAFAPVRIVRTFILTSILAASACGSSGIGAPDANADAAPSDAPPIDTASVDARPEALPVQRSRGCGMTLLPGSTPSAANRRYTRLEVMTTGANLTDVPIAAKAGPRAFWVRVPAAYDPERPYRVVFEGGTCATAGMSNMSTLPLFRDNVGTDDAIYVAVEPAPDRVALGETCYQDDEGPRSGDWEAFDLMMSFIDQRYCTDLNKVYVVGFSGSTTLANRWGCYFGGGPDPARKFAPGYHIRAQVALWGGEPTEQPPCSGPVAAFFMRGTLGALAPIEPTAKSLTRVGAANGCNTNYDDASAQTPWHTTDLPEGLCQSFTGCQTTAPVVLCRPTVLAQSGTLESFSVPAITRFFDELEAP